MNTDTPRPVATSPDSDFTLTIDGALERYGRAGLSRGEPKNSRIIGYIWDEPSSKTHAIIFDTLTGEISEYAMNIQTRKPYWVRTIRVEPVSHKRPRKFGSAMWRATKAWEERWDE